MLAMKLGGVKAYLAKTSCGLEDFWDYKDMRGIFLL